MSCPGNNFHRTHDLMILIVAVSVVLLALTLRVRRPDQRVELRCISGAPLPHICVTRTWLNIECPGCGLTRSFIYLAAGQWRAAFSVHRLGLLLAVLVIGQIPYRVLRLTVSGRGWVFQPAPRWVMGVIVASLISNWLIDACLRFRA